MAQENDLESVPKFSSIKEEPFEEFFVPVSVLAQTETCCLCPEGTELQKKLYDHIRVNHWDESTFTQEPQLTLSCCFCEDGIRIQTDLINHLLSHFTVKNESEVMSSQEDNDQTIFERKSLRLKTKPKNDFRLCTEKRFTCNVCLKNFHQRQKLQRHVLREHGASKTPSADSCSAKVHCEVCPKVFKYKQGALKHWRLEHDPSNQFPCSKTDCTSRCKTLKNLHAHLRTHDPPRAGVDTLQCHKCFKLFPTQKQLTLHFYTHREKFFCCDLCGSKFNNREQIKNHVLRHAGLFHNKISHQKIICDECSTLVFSHKMKRHKLIHHSDEKPFKCEFTDCNAAFSDNRLLNDHKNIHLKIKPYKCEYCSEAFRSGSNLRLHRVRHTDPERYRCEECQTCFVTNQALQKHNRRHMEDPEIRPYHCEFEGCLSTFKQKEHVRNHYRRAHEKTDEVFRCDIENCTKSYDRKDALGKHLRKAHNIFKKKPRLIPIIIESNLV